MQTATIDNSVPVLQLEEVVIGSQLQIAIQFEKLVSENPDVFEPIDFTDMILQADIKVKAKDEVAITEFSCVPRVTGDGWVDLYLSGTETGLLSEKTYESSLKVWPTGFPEKGDTLVTIVLPAKFKATR